MAATGTVAELVDAGGRRWWLIGDRLLPVIAGASETASEGTGGAGSEGNTDTGGEGEQEGESEEGSEESEGESETETPAPAKQKADKEYRARQRARAAEERATKAERELEEIRDRDKSDLERASGRATKAEGRVATLESTVRDQAVHIAFLLASAGDGAKRKPINWVDPEDALVLARKELDGIKVGDDGEIDFDEVRGVVDDLARRKSHLIRKQVQTQTPSGGNVGAGRQGQQETSAEELAKIYPALRGHL